MWKCEWNVVYGVGSSLSDLLSTWCRRLNFNGSEQPTERLLWGRFETTKLYFWSMGCEPWKLVIHIPKELAEKLRVLWSTITVLFVISMLDPNTSEHRDKSCRHCFYQLYDLRLIWYMTYLIWKVEIHSALQVGFCQCLGVSFCWWLTLNCLSKLAIDGKLLITWI